VSSDDSGTFFTLLASAVSMVFGLGILLRQALLLSYTVAGWTGAGILLTLLAVVLFTLHIWLNGQIPHWKYDY
jgi:hypothetical protein